VKLFSSKRRIVAAAALIVLALFLLRPGASRLQSRIASSISSAVGRPVEIGPVHLRLLPQPGFDLENLVVYDDPAFGAEPMLRASEVTANLRLISLMRGRLEISRLDLTEPSLNLVQAEDGRWNLEALLERTAHIPLAPTAKPKSEARPGFPYIQATSARINFKNGPEKKPYALTNADFSLWQDSENSWGVRLKAQPFRSDLNLNDMGMLQVSGTWQRANTLRETPMRFLVEWNRAQLGQLSKFFTGNDQGWRGDVVVDATVSGTPTKLQIASDGSIQDFRRYDITSGQALRLAGHCDGEYSSFDHEVHGLLCSAPVGSGMITVQGDMGLPRSASYALTLTADNVPASAAAMLVQRVKKNLPEDLVADGTMGGSLHMERNSATASQLRFEGRGEFDDLRVASTTSKVEVGPETLPFLLTSDGSETGPELRRVASHGKTSSMRFPDGPHVEFGPFPVMLGRTPSTARGWVNRGGYSLSVVGEAEIARSLQVARMLGLPALQSSAEGTAQVDLRIAGSWAGRSNGTTSGFTGPQVTGLAKLRNVHIAMGGAASPVEVASADMQLFPDSIRVAKLNARTGSTWWTGSMEMPRGCGIPRACEVHFVLSANQIALGTLHEWVSPSPKERPWYRVLESNAKTGPSFLTSVRASGQIITERLQVQRLTATRVSAKVALDSGKLRISEFNADFMGGKQRGQWQADFREKPSVCEGSGSLNGVSLDGLADVMNDEWIAGTASGTYAVKGACTPEFWTSGEGTLRFAMRDGRLPHVALSEDAGTFKVTEFSGQARLHAGEIEMKDASLESPDGKFRLSGTASLQGELDFRLARTPNGGAGSGYTITGTLEEPHVNPASSGETQARLKP
jgi:uncharacterized protein involved in outer membrane biogenesis